MTEPLTRKERMAMARVDMPERDPALRARSFDEVNLGLTAQMARLEAMRCIECRRPTCVAGCPVGIHIDEFVLRVAEGDFAGAGAVIRNDNLLPAIWTGRSPSAIWSGSSPTSRQRTRSMRSTRCLRRRAGALASLAADLPAWHAPRM